MVAGDEAEGGAAVDEIAEDVAVVGEVDEAVAEVVGVPEGVQEDGEAVAGVEVDQGDVEVLVDGGWVRQLAQGQGLLH